MTDYQFSTKIIWPHEPPPSAETARMMEKFGRMMDEQIRAAIVGQVARPADPPQSCGCYMLHRSDCRYFCA